MSYRSIKRLLGETSLERKCRFLFGSGLMILITGSFYFYSRVNQKLVYDQIQSTARKLIVPTLLEAHWKTVEPEKELSDKFAEMAADLKKIALEDEGLEDYEWSLWKPDPTTAQGDDRPSSQFGYHALGQIKQGQDEVIHILHDEGEYHYFGAIRAVKSCKECHKFQQQAGETVPVEVGDLIGVAKLSFPLKNTERALAINNAYLLTMAIVTAFLAMIAAYAIVRYVIVKPVLHLKDVSDEIARGNLDLRADIHTGDEFEELSHAFNRMLRHLVTIQDELRDVNTNLDAKVDQLAQVNLQLYEINKLKDEFLATMSHELRTPLNSILGFSDVLSQADNLTEKQTRFLKNINSSGKELMALINDILDLAKIESGKMELQVVEFDLHDLVERQVDSLKPLADKKDIELNVHQEPDFPHLFQDPGKIQQILNNLISNAIKFTPEGGQVHLGIHSKTQDRFELVVQDTGIGIPLEDQASIFEKFRQGRTIPGQRDAMTREYGGTGLGLSIVKELCKLLQGEINLKSEFGKGSIFTVNLPIHLDRCLINDRLLVDPLQNKKISVQVSEVSTQTDSGEE